MTECPNVMRNRAFAYGDGLFETIRVIQGRMPLWHWHWQRLHSGAGRLLLDAPDSESLRKAIRQKLSRVAPPPAAEGTPVASPATGTVPVSGVLKLVLFRQARGTRQKRGYCPAGSDSAYVLDFFPESQPLEQTGTTPQPLPLRVKCCDIRLSWQPALAGIKHLNRLENILACAEVRASGHDDGLLLDGEDNLIEATSSNAVFLRGNEILTPDLSRCGVHGVALSWLKEQYSLTVGHIPFSQLESMDALLLCNSVTGFRTVIQAAHHRFDASLQKPLVRQRINEIMRAWDGLLDTGQ